MTSRTPTALWLSRHNTPETLENLARQIAEMVRLLRRSQAMMAELKYDKFVAEIDAALAGIPKPEGTPDA